MASDIQAQAVMGCDQDKACLEPFGSPFDLAQGMVQDKPVGLLSISNHILSTEQLRFRLMAAFLGSIVAHLLCFILRGYIQDGDSH